MREWLRGIGEGSVVTISTGELCVVTNAYNGRRSRLTIAEITSDGERKSRKEFDCDVNDIVAVVKYKS